MLRMRSNRSRKKEANANHREQHSSREFSAIIWFPKA
jgi:hypothetical protein